MQYSGTDSDEFQTSGTEPRLVADLTVVCYGAEHNSAVIFDYFLLFGFGVGVPLAACVLLWRAFRPSNTATATAAQVMPTEYTPTPRTVGMSSIADAGTMRYAEAEMRIRSRRNDRFGYLYRGLVPAAYFFRLFLFITNWAFALQLVFSSSVGLQLFVPGLFFLLNVIGTALLWPYATALNNVISIWVGFGGVLQVEVYLGLIGSQSSAPDGVWAFLYFVRTRTNARTHARTASHRLPSPFADGPCVVTGL